MVGMRHKPSNNIQIRREVPTVETLLVRDIVDEKNAHSAPIVRRGYGPEAFLTCEHWTADQLFAMHL